MWLESSLLFSRVRPSARLAAKRKGLSIWVARCHTYFQAKNPDLGGLAIEDVGIFFGHLAPFTIFCNILWTFDTVGILYQENSGNPDRRHGGRTSRRSGGPTVLNSLTCVGQNLCSKNHQVEGFSHRLL
jgi:hypothetical protein